MHRKLTAIFTSFAPLILLVAEGCNNRHIDDNVPSPANGNLVSAVPNAELDGLREEYYAQICAGEHADPEALKALEEQRTKTGIPSQKIEKYDQVLLEFGIDNETLAVVAANMFKELKMEFPMPACGFDISSIAEEMKSLLEQTEPEIQAFVTEDIVEGVLKNLERLSRQALADDGVISVEEAIMVEDGLGLSSIEGNVSLGAKIAAVQVLQDLGIKTPQPELIEALARSLAEQEKGVREMLQLREEGAVPEPESLKI